MNPSTECLDNARITSLLHGILNPVEFQSVQDHLEMCEPCRHQVEAAIGPVEWWEDVQRELLHSRIPLLMQGHTGDDAVTNTTPTAKLLELLGPTDDPNMLGRIGPYEITGLLGQGGMGAVFKGFDRTLHRFVAIKMLLPHLAASGAARKRFAREAQAVAAVVDDHVMAIHCVDEWQGMPYLVMTYSRGVSLQTRLIDSGPLEIREILRIGMQAAQGLAAAHAQGIVHRDIKPANIFLDQNVERVQLMDFGLARAADDASLTRSGTLAGTPQYMSPEQARAEAVDHRSDLFSLGSVLYAMCTGHAPFRAESSYSVLRLITDKEPRPIREMNPEVPEWLCAIIVKLMAKQVEDRFESAQEVARLLERCLAHVQQPTTHPLPENVGDLPPESLIEKPQPALGRSHARPQLGLKRLFTPRIAKFIALGSFAFSLILAGIVMVMVSNTGTLTIESESNDVPAGPASPSTLQQRRTQVTSEQALSQAIMEFNHLHPNDARGKPQPPLTQDEFFAAWKWNMGNDQLSDPLIKAIRLDPSTRQHLLPAGWKFVGGQIDEGCPYGVVRSWQIKLDTDGLSKPLVIRRSAIALATEQDVSRVVDTSESMIAIESLVEQFNTTHQEIERRGQLDHDLSPLTENELLAALALSCSEETSPKTDEHRSKRLEQILATRHFPQGTRLEAVPLMENAYGQRFYAERIQLLIPDVDDPAHFEAFSIRSQFISQDYDPRATHWSKPGENGLQVGMRFLPAAHTYRNGQVVDIDFLYRSATSRKIPVTLPAVFQFDKVRGIRLERVRFVKPKWPDGSTHTWIGNEPLVVRGHRMQICFNRDEELKPGVNLRAITRPEAHHYLYLTMRNLGDDSKGETLEIAERIDFSIAPLTPPKILPLYESHYYQHWGASVPNYRLPTASRPDPEFADTFQIGVSLGPAEPHRIPAYFPSGLKVTKVAPHSPAAAVGIEVDDIILSWEGNQIYGDDPAKPFAHYAQPNIQLKEATERYSRSEGWSNFNIDLDLLDHRTGEVIRITPTFGAAANGGLHKAELLKRMALRKRLRQRSE